MRDFELSLLLRRGIGQHRFAVEAFAHLVFTENVLYGVGMRRGFDVRKVQFCDFTDLGDNSP